MPNKDVVEFRKARTSKIFKYFSAYDLEKVEFDKLQFISKEERSCYGIRISKYNKRYYVFKEDCTNEEDYRDILDSIEEVNGYIKALYKVYHCMIEVK